MERCDVSQESSRPKHLRQPRQVESHGTCPPPPQRYTTFIRDFRTLLQMRQFDC
jgi:hypothetical protein